MQQLTFDSYNEPPPGVSDSQANASPQETLATIAGKVYTLVKREDNVVGSCAGCVAHICDDNASETSRKARLCNDLGDACWENLGVIWKEKT